MLNDHSDPDDLMPCGWRRYGAKRSSLWFNSIHSDGLGENETQRRLTPGGQNELEIDTKRLRESVETKLRLMLRLNPTRIGYLDRYQSIIQEYETGCCSASDFAGQMVDLARDLRVEERRAIEKRFSEEELAMFDLLVPPAVQLCAEDEGTIRKLVWVLLDTLKREKLGPDWRRRRESRAAVRECIERILDGLPRSYSQEMYQNKCEVVYQHVLRSYFGPGRSVYTPLD